MNPVNGDCLPPLVAAVKHQRVSYSEESDLGTEIIQYLLDHGADIMYKTRFVYPLQQESELGKLIEPH